jgi:hypothetical protein
MEEIPSSSKWSESVMRNKMRSLFGIESVEVYESRNEDGIWCFKIGIFPTRGQGYEETVQCCVRESGEVLWKHPHS